jgi:hypothetical protein
MNVIVVLLMVFLGVFSSSGTTSDEPPGEPSATTPPTGAEPPSDDPFPDDLGPLRGDRAIEQRFLTRYPLPTCDFVDTGDSANPEPGSYDCLQEAVEAGEGAELVIATMRPGGDQAYVYYRTNPDGPLEIFVDLQGDGRDWDYVRCRPSENIAEEPCA